MAKKEPPTVESIKKECAEEVRKGLGRKRLTKAARDYWDGIYTKSIQDALNNGGDWSQDRKRVLPVARKLGKVANALTTKNLVMKWAAEAASVAVKADPGCPSVGAGGYCEVN